MLRKLIFKASLWTLSLCFVFHVSSHAQENNKASSVPPAETMQNAPDLPFTNLTDEQQGDIFYRDYVQTRLQKTYALFKRAAMADTYLHVCDPDEDNYKRAPYRLKADAIARYFKQDIKRFKLLDYNFHTDIYLDATYILVAGESKRYFLDTECKGSRARDARDFIENLSALRYDQFDNYLRFIEKY